MRLVFAAFGLILPTIITYSDSSSDSLLRHYTSTIKAIDNNTIYFINGKHMVYDDFNTKTAQELLDRPDVQDQFHYSYNKTFNTTANTDAGRIRSDAFFKAVYGANAQEVSRNLTEVVWCPKLVNTKLRFSRINGANKALERVSQELDQHPEWKKYLTNIGGTFNWRVVNGTKRLSSHSFGITIDLNTRYSHYWQWDCKCTDENTIPQYHNNIPQGIVEIFEKHGFIWGGKWKHYDTMHFEYRPELF